MYKLIKLLLVAIFFSGCNSFDKNKKDLKIEYEKIELDNGLDVIFHIDKSDPVVAVELMVHVGSSREIKGRTGFAHLFEHLLFLESENLGKGGLDKMSARIGGSGANGSTSNDRTNYLQSVPKDALEKMIWAEADKLGWFINTVTEPVLEKEKQVVKNEKRQSYDNRPYGHNQYVIDKNLYPEDHPYNWQVIGSLEDLQNATLEDVKSFFRKWYVPNNSTLVLSGDIDVNQAKEWVYKYFNEIPGGEEIIPLNKRPAKLFENKKFYYEDNFARLPQLTMVWPAVERYHPDSYALDILCEYLTDGKSAPLNKVLVDQLRLTSRTSMFNYKNEIAGQVQLTVRSFENISLDKVSSGINEAFVLFEKNGISKKTLNRIKAGQETSFYRSLSSVLGKGDKLALYNTFTGNPGFLKQDITQKLNVTVEDVMKVYNKYIKGKFYLTTSFVPKTRSDLALKSSILADVSEEKIIIGAEAAVNPNISSNYEKTPSTFDRSKEPNYGPPISIRIPEIYIDSLANGLKIYGIENDEVPLVSFNLSINGGQLLDSFDKTGLAYITASLMNKGTKNKTVNQLEEAIKELGASIYISCSSENISVSGTTLSKNYEETVLLVEEMLLEPRFDETEFEILKKSISSNILQQKANPYSIADNAFNKLIYGEKNIRSKNILGTYKSLESITIDDVKSFYNNNFSPSVSKILVVGNLGKDELINSLGSIESNWKSKKVKIPSYTTPKKPENSQVYFIDVPGAKQSILLFGSQALSATDTDYYPASVMNYILGGGGFASRLTQELREGKGYTYGINSRFYGTNSKGTFTISSAVRSNVTLESAELIKNILTNYPKTFSENDLETTKSFLIKSNARAFETSNAKLSILSNISNYNLDLNYVEKREKIVKNMTVERIEELANKYVDPNKMIWLVVGDAKTQFKRMEGLGFGKPITLK